MNIQNHQKRTACGLDKLALVLLAVTVGVPVCSANLISNSDFETNAVANFKVLPTNDTTSLPGWKVTGSVCTTNCLLVLNTIYTEPSNIGTIFFQSQSGVQSVDLNGGGNTLDGGIEQTVATVAGTNYSLTFYLGNMDNAADLYTAASTVRLKITGQTDQLLSNSNNTPNHVNWVLETINFTATSALTTIDFIQATPATDNYVGIDNVQLNAVSSGPAAATPEPSTWALMIVAAILLGVRRVRVARAC